MAEPTETVAVPVALLEELLDAQAGLYQTRLAGTEDFGSGYGLHLRLVCQDLRKICREQRGGQV